MFYSLQKKQQNMYKMFDRIQNILELPNNEDRVFTDVNFSDIGAPISPLKDCEPF